MKREVIIALRDLASLQTGNQATLGSGCVCESGCADCVRLAEAWGAMVEALKPFAEIDECWIGVLIGPDSDHTCYECKQVLAARAALTLARRAVYRDQEVKP